MQKKSLRDIVKYICSFEELIGSELRDDVKNVEIIEEMEEDIKEREREIAEQYEKDIEDTIRESVGLSSLSPSNESVSISGHISDNYINRFFKELIGTSEIKSRSSFS